MNNRLRRRRSTVDSYTLTSVRRCDAAQLSTNVAYTTRCHKQANLQSESCCVFSTMHCVTCITCGTFIIVILNINPRGTNNLTIDKHARLQLADADQNQIERCRLVATVHFEKVESQPKENPFS